MSRRKRKKIVYNSEVERKRVDIPTEFMKMRPKDPNLVGKFLNLPKMKNFIHQEMIIERRGGQERPLFVTKCFIDLFEKFHELLESEFNREKKNLVIDDENFVHIVEGCHGVGKSTSLYALACWIFYNAKHWWKKDLLKEISDELDEDRVFFLLYLPMKYILESTDVNEVRFKILNLFVRQNEDLLEELYREEIYEEEDCHFGINEWTKDIKFTSSSTYDQAKDYKDDIDKQLRSLMRRLKNFLCLNNVALLVDDSNFAFDYDERKGIPILKKQIEDFFKNFLCVKHFRNHSTIVTGTSRSEFKEYIDSFDQGRPYKEYTIEPLEKEQVLPFIKSFQEKVENTPYSKLKLKNEETDMDLLYAWTGGIPYYLFLLGEFTGSDWRGNDVYESLRLKLSAKYQKRFQVALNSDSEGFCLSLRTFADTILMDMEYRFLNDHIKRLLVDPAFIKKKKNGKSEYEAVNSMGLSFLMTTAYSLYELHVSKITVGELDDQRVKGIAFEFNLQSQIASGMEVRLESLAKFSSGGSSPVIPRFSVRTVSVLYGSKKCENLRCNPVSVGDCVFLKPKADNFPFMDFFVIDRKETIAESTVLCVQATIGDFYDHIYSGRPKNGFGEIGKFMFGSDTFESEQPKSHLMKLLSLMFETDGKSVSFKYEEKEKSMMSGHSRIEVLVKEEDEEVEGESNRESEWKPMEHFQILYVVGNEVSQDSAKKVMMKNCCYLDKIGMKSIFPNLC